MTVLFCDVTGFTSMAEQIDPEVLRARMNRYFAEARHVIQAHGGVVEKFIGDAVMAVFGIPSAHEDDAVRALRAATELRDRVSVSGELDLRIGVATGEVIAGDASQGEGFVTGDPVNVAARLQQASDPGEILIDATTLTLGGQATRAEPAGERTLRGKREAVVAHRLLWVASVGAATDPADDSPMLGRDEELDQLRGTLDRVVRERRPYLFTLVGTPGVGKSRLARALMRELPHLDGRCLPYGEGVTYWPVREMAEQIARPDADGATDRLAAHLQEDADAELIASRIAAIVGWTQEPIPVEDAAWAVRRLVEVEARRLGQLVVLIDDIQWAEPPLLDVVEHVLDWSRNTPALIVCLARPELLSTRPSWGGGRVNATTLLLEPLAPGAAFTMASQRADAMELPREVIARIVEIADGIPLFIEQLIAARAEVGGDERSIPPTIQALLRSRIDALASAETAVLTAASIVGEEFPLAELEALVGLDPQETGRALAGLMRRELITPSARHGTYRFRHLLIRDAAYDAQPKRERAERHARYAAWLASAHPDLPEITAHHFESAMRFRAELGLPRDERLVDDARGVMNVAAQRAQARNDWRAARILFERCLELTPPSERDRLQLLDALSEAQYHDGDFANAARSADEGVELARSLGDSAAGLRLAIRRAEARRATDPQSGVAEARRLLEEARGDLETVHDELALAAYWRLDADIADYEGRMSRASASHRRAVEHARRAGDPVVLQQLEDERHFDLLGFVPIPDEIARYRRLLAEAPEGSLRQSKLLSTIGLLTGVAGDTDAARRLFDEAAAVHGGATETPAYFAERDARGMVETWEDNLEIAEQLTRETMSLLLEMGERFYASTYIADLARVVALRGRADEAFQLADEAEALRAPDDWWVACMSSQARGDAHLHVGRIHEAMTLSARAMEIADERELPLLHIETRLSRARALAAAGQRDEANAVLDDAKWIADEKGLVIAGRRVDRLVARLGLGGGASAPGSPRPPGVQTMDDLVGSDHSETGR